MSEKFYQLEDGSRRVVGRIMMLDDGTGYVTLKNGYRHDTDGPLWVFEKQQGEAWVEFGDRREEKP